MFFNFKMPLVKNCFKLEIRTMQMSQDSTGGRKKRHIGAFIGGGLGPSGNAFKWFTNNTHMTVLASLFDVYCPTEVEAYMTDKNPNPDLRGKTGGEKAFRLQAAKASRSIW